MRRFRGFLLLLLSSQGVAEPLPVISLQLAFDLAAQLGELFAHLLLGEVPANLIFYFGERLELLGLLYGRGGRRCWSTGRRWCFGRGWGSSGWHFA